MTIERTGECEECGNRRSPVVRMYVGAMVYGPCFCLDCLREAVAELEAAGGCEVRS